MRRALPVLLLIACQDFSVEKLEPVLENPDGGDTDPPEEVAADPGLEAAADTDAALEESDAPLPEEPPAEEPPPEEPPPEEPPATDTAVDTDLPPEDTAVTPVVPPPVPPPVPPGLPASCPAAPDPVLMAPCAPGVAAWNNNRTFANLDNALRTSQPGDQVVVCPGSWRGPFQVPHELDLIAADPTPGATILTGGGRDQVLLHQSGRLTLRGLSLRNGRTQNNGGALASSGDLLLECMFLEDNEAGYGGGAISSSGSLVIRTTVLRNNTAGYEGGAISSGGPLTLEDSLLVGNHADYEGGAANVPNHARIIRTTLRGNTADYGGGALQFGTRSDFTLELVDSVFEDNEASYEGGGITFGTWAADTLVAERTIFRGNRAPSGAAIEFGSWGAFTATLEDCTLVGNTNQDGPALSAGGWLRQGGALTLTRTMFVGNESLQGSSAFNTNGRAAPIHVQATDITVHRNQGAGSAFELQAHDTMVCSGCDFGQGPDDNSPSDLTHGGTTRAQVPANFQL